MQLTVFGVNVAVFRFQCVASINKDRKSTSRSIFKSHSSWSYHYTWVVYGFYVREDRVYWLRRLGWRPPMSCWPSRKLELGSIRLKFVPLGVCSLASIIKLLDSSKMRSLFQKRNFGKVFGLVKRTSDLDNQSRVKILKVPTGANSSIVM